MRLMRILTPRALRPLVSLLTREANREMCCRRSSESFSSLVRLYAHAVEKSVYAATFDPQRGVQRSLHLKLLLADAMRSSLDQETLEWADKILEMYENRRTSGGSLTQLAATPSTPALDVDALESFISARRSVRNFQSTCVSDSAFLRAVEVMRWAPTSCHRQAVKIFATLKAELAREAHACCAGKSGFGEHIPAFAAFCADSNVYSFPEEFSLPFVDSAICFSFFLLGLHAIGMAAVPMAWNQCRLDDEKRLRKLLRIPDQYVIGVNCVFGVPAGRSPTNPRKATARWFEICN